MNEPDKRTSISRPLSEAAAWGAVALAPVGAVLFLFGRWVHLRFYQQFGLIPDDLGFGYATTLSATAVGLVVVVALFVVLWLVVALILGVALILVSFLESMGWVRRLSRARPVAAVIRFTVGSQEDDSPYVWRLTRWLGGGRRVRRFVLLPWVVYSVVAMLIVVISYGYGAVVEAERVLDGGTIRASSPTGIGFASWRDFGIRAEPAVAYWTGTPERPVAEGRPLTYLGHGAEFVYLYDVAAREMLVIPAGDVVVRLTGEHRESCILDANSSPADVICESP